MADRDLQALYAGRAEKNLGQRVESIWAVNEQDEVLQLAATAHGQCVVVTDVTGLDEFRFLQELPASTDLIVVRAPGETPPQQHIARVVELSGEFDDWLTQFRKLI
jgi:hypothetical protein